MVATSSLGGVAIWHRYDFESGFDGGNASYRVNGGAWQPLTFLLGGYDDTIFGGTDNPLAGQDGWTGTDNSVFSALLTLSLNPGDTYQMALNGGWDFSIVEQGANWEVFKVKVFGFEEVPNTTVPEPSTIALMATGLVGLGLAARRRKQ
jgi:hypothetical protein